METFRPPKDVDLKSLHLQKPLETTWTKTNSQFLSGLQKPSGPFTPLQKELFLLMNSYRDVFYPERTALKNGEEIRHVYCLHAVNHVLKANAQVLSNNSRRRSQKLGVGDDDDFRDQGLTRPKVSGSRRALPGVLIIGGTNEFDSGHTGWPGTVSGAVDSPVDCH